MRRLVPSIVVGGLLAGGLAVAAPAAAAPGLLHAGHALHRGHQLVSANGRYRAAVESTGRLVIRTKAGSAVWRTPKGPRNSMLYLGRTGRLIVKAGATVRWGSGTSGSGSSNVLTMRNDGALALTNGGLTVWTNRLSNKCPRTTTKKAFDVDLSAQTARMCRAGQQLRVTRVTTGATAKGSATPKGTWHVYAKTRNTTLRPAAGGAYPVKYWVPYSGPYGVHDSSWQKFPYGSSKYRTRGSHGCTHVPARAMAWLFKWVRVGTTVRVHS